MQLNQVIPLIDKLARREQSPEEMETIRVFLQQAGREDAEAVLGHYYTALEGINTNSDTKALAYRLEQLISDKPVAPVHRVHFLKTAWFKYAAAIIILLTGIATYYLVHTSQSQVEVAETRPSPLPKEDVMPGSDRAVLTLSNGEQVQLNNATSETIKDGILPISNVDGELKYGVAAGTPFAVDTGSLRSPLKARSGVPVAYNTMTTPRGGQYKLTLADGTKVWLNAASSITYPTAFNEKTREVKITGEAYFEVAANAKQPFIVKAPQEEITVLGTSFNIRSYETEQSKTTLLEGSVRISPAGRGEPSEAKVPREAPEAAGGGSRSEQQLANSVILQPGQQAQLKNNRLELSNNINPKEILAWKSGNFYFDNQPLKSILEEFSRWYDVEIEYKGKLNNRTFFGIVKRDKPLSHVLELLKDNDIRFEIEGRKLIVQSD